MSHPPLNLSARDFDAYAAEKATSNVYSRPRIEVKQRALGWARAVVARLAELGIAVEVYGSDEHPSRSNKKRVDCQWVFFSRDQAARDELDRLLDRGRSIAAEIDDPSPFTRHAFLALRLDAASVEVCFAVHPEARVDVDNLRARLSVEDAVAELIAALRALPEQFTLGVSPDDRVAVSAVTPEKLRALVEQAAAGQVPLWIGWSVQRETAIEHSALLDEQLADAIAALASRVPSRRLVARQRSHRARSPHRERRAGARPRPRRGRGADRALARGASRGAPPLRRAGAPPPSERRPLRAHCAPPSSWKSCPTAPRSDTLFAPRQPPPHVPKTSSSPPAAPAPVASLQAARAPSVPPPSPVPQVEPDGERFTPPPVIEKGVKVRVLSGPFADKLGVIGELDGRGGARVLLGLLSTRLEVADLEPVAEGRERPALQSSHRRPAAPAPRKAR